MEYRYPLHNVRFELEVKRSRFIASLAHVSNREECTAFINLIRKEFPGASHHCTAYVAGSPNDGAVLGGSDDGEVAGTAFRPMLNILLHSGLGEICAVVTRFYGGTKLGTGGLVRAYSQCLAEAIALLESEAKVSLSTLHLGFDFCYEAAIRRHVTNFSGSVFDQKYEAQVLLELQVPSAKVNEFVSIVRSECKGDIHVRYQDSHDSS